MFALVFLLMTGLFPSNATLLYDSNNDSLKTIVYDFKSLDSENPFRREFIPPPNSAFSFTFELEEGSLPPQDVKRKLTDLTLLIAMNDFYGRTSGNTNFLVSVLRLEKEGWRFYWALGNPVTNRPVGSYAGPPVRPGESYPVDFRFHCDSAGVLLSVECRFNGTSIGRHGFLPDSLALTALTVELGPLRSGFAGKRGRLFFRDITYAGDTPEQSLPGPRIHEVFFAEPGKKTPLQSLIRGRWVDLRIRLSDPRGPDSLGFVLTWISSPAYTDGVFETKGGRFSGRDNYVFNFSFNPLRAFEKQTPMRFNTTRLNAKTGLYTDARPETFRFHPAESLVVCRVRLLPEADTGLWSVRSCLEGENLNRSPVWQSSIRVMAADPAEKRRAFRLLPSILALGAALAIVLFFLQRGRFAGPQPSSSPPSPAAAPDPRFTRLRNHVSAHLGQELNIAEIEKELGLSYYALNKVVKAETGQSLKNWVLTLRLDRARELLKTTDKSVMDILFETGFNNPAHFSTIFRKYTGKSPSEFRNRG